MARPKPSRPALWPIALFFLAGAAAAVLWDLRKQAAMTEALVPDRPAEDARPAGTNPRAKESGRMPPSTRIETARRPPDRAAERPRRKDGTLERVGIPMDARQAAPASQEGIGESRAERILRRLIEERGYYGLPPSCLRARPLGLRDGNYEFEVVAASCESIARGSVIGRWRVHATSGDPSYRTPEGTYAPAP